MSLSTWDTSFSAIVGRLLDSLGVDADVNPGSVTRTLSEAYAREMATFYAMLEQAHRSGYLDTAEGGALDNVVAVLGLERARAGRLTGWVEFRRASPAPEDIGIPAGCQVTGLPLEGKPPRPLPSFETLGDAVLRRGELRVAVPVQEVREGPLPANEPALLLNPGQLTVMPRPVLGIESVTNLAPLRREGEDETDESLRLRARAALRSGESGTLEAIGAAVRQLGVRQVTVREPEDAPPGIVDVLVGDPDFERDPERVRGVERAVREAKAAGIRVRLRYTRTIYFQVGFAVEPVDPELDESSFEQLRRELRQSLTRFFQELPVGEPVSRRKLEAVLFANPAVRRISGLWVSTFLWGEAPDGTGAARLVPEVEGRMYGPESDWRLEDTETAVIDLEKKPPAISRFRPSTYRVDLVVALPSTDPRTPEQVRQALRGALELCSARIAEDALQGREARFTWELLVAVLTQPSGSVRVTEVKSCVLTDPTGTAATLSKEGDGWTLAPGARLALGTAERVGLG